MLNEAQAIWLVNITFLVIPTGFVVLVLRGLLKKHKAERTRLKWLVGNPPSLSSGRVIHQTYFTDLNHARTMILLIRAYMVICIGFEVAWLYQCKWHVILTFPF